MKNGHSKLRKILSLVLGLMVGGAGAVYADSIIDSKQPATVLDNFDYASHRKGYEGKIFNYNLLSSAVISQSDKKGVNIEPIWFYDIDNDGKFGKGEIDAIKAGIPIFMHRAFNEIANAEVRKFLEIASEYSSLSEKLKQEEKNSQTYQKRINELEAKLIEYQSQLQKETPEASLESPKYKEKIKLPLPEVPEKTEKEKLEKPHIDISLLTEVNNNFAFNTFGGAVGVRFNSPKGKRIGLGVLLDGSLSLDKLVDSYTAPLSAGRSAYGMVKDTNIKSIGILAELQTGPFFIGTGINYENWITNIIEQILDASGGIVKSNINSVSKGEVSGKGYFGLELGPENWKARFTAGYGRHGVYSGIGTVIKLNSKKGKRE